MDQSWNVSRSSGGMPNSSAITIAGSGLARSPIRSMRPRGMAASSRSSTTRSITDCQRCSADGVKAWLPRTRSRWWSWPSFMSIMPVVTRVKSAARAGSLPRSCARTETSAVAELSAGCRVAASTSS